MKNVSTDVIRQVYSDGHCVEVGPDGDGLGIELRTVGVDNVEWFGAVHLTLSAEMARELGKALIKAADEMDQEAK